MAFDDYKSKKSLVVVYTGESKGKTTASIGLMCRALGTGWSVAFIQFIKHWPVGEHRFIKKIKPIFGDKLLFYKGGRGFFNAGALSEKGVTPADHKAAALKTFEFALKTAKSGKYKLVVCDEINNAINDGLLTNDHLQQLIEQRHIKTSLCLTGRNFPPQLIEKVDIATSMNKIKHHFDEKYLANKGIDY